MSRVLLGLLLLGPWSAQDVWARAKHKAPPAPAAHSSGTQTAVIREPRCAAQCGSRYDACQSGCNGDISCQKRCVNQQADCNKSCEHTVITQVK